MFNQYLYDILDEEGFVQDHRAIYALDVQQANDRVRELRTEGDTWHHVQTILNVRPTDKKDESCNIIQFTGFTKQGDELEEWRDDETGQHCVVIQREARGFADIVFFFESQIEAHALFLALCDVKTVFLDGEDT